MSKKKSIFYSLIIFCIILLLIAKLTIGYAAYKSNIRAMDSSRVASFALSVFSTDKISSLSTFSANGVMSYYFNITNQSSLNPSKLSETAIGYIVNVTNISNSNNTLSCKLYKSNASKNRYELVTLNSDVITMPASSVLITHYYELEITSTFATNGIQQISPKITILANQLN